VPAPTDSRKKRILSSSNKVLESIGELKDLERRKRREKVSTRPYHQLADDVEAKSREIFRAARDETATAYEMESGSPSIDELAAEAQDATD
jgi:hypothetical protein